MGGLLAVAGIAFVIGILNDGPNDATHGTADQSAISKDSFAGTWPFSVDEGQIGCGVDGATTFTADGTTYALNSSAEADGQFADLDEIMLPDRPSLADVLARGTARCGVPTTERPWIPPYFKESADGETAWRFMPSGTFDCSRNTACLAIEVVPKYGCSSLYAEMTLLDGDGRVIDYSNDTASDVRSGERAELIFESYNDEVEKDRIAEINCH